MLYSGCWGKIAGLSVMQRRVPSFAGIYRASFFQFVLHNSKIDGLDYAVAPNLIVA